MARVQAHFTIVSDEVVLTFPLHKKRDWLYTIDFMRDSGFVIDELDAYSVEAILP